MKSFFVFTYKLNFLTLIIYLQFKNALLHMKVKTSSHRWRFVLVPISWRRTLTSCWLRSLWAWSLFLISLESWSMQPKAVLHCILETMSTLHHPFSVYLLWILFWILLKSTIDHHHLKQVYISIFYSIMFL